MEVFRTASESKQLSVNIYSVQTSQTSRCKTKMNLTFFSEKKNELPVTCLSNSSYCEKMRVGFGTSSEMCRSGERVKMKSILNKNITSNREYVIF